ncbi:MAG: hypothetical protein IJM37_05455 [Lachnospiraceae bacterium]|nr:hypothetical protein [Lachnospiraceae bacterium]
MKDILLDALKYGLIFFMLAFVLHFAFPQDVDMLTCFIVFAATGAAKFLIGFIRYKKSEKK